MSNVLTAVGVVGGLGLLFGALLSFASKVFHVKVDYKVEAVRAALPGANCGACGFPGCDGMAAHIALEDGPVNGCPVGGQPVADKVAEIMGKVAVAGAKEVACVMCQGDATRAKERYTYTGPRDCRSNAATGGGGSKACTFGCLGGGTCKDYCQFGAIEIINGLAVIDKEKCTACGKCVEVCPKKIIEMVPYDQEVMVKCKNTEPGKEVRQKCAVGCIACNLCARTAPEAFVVENNLAKAQFPFAQDPAEAVQKCPTGCIYPGLAAKEAAKQEKAV